MNVLIVHGSYGKPFENWFPWLENELTKKNINCLVPSFPTPEHQVYDDWRALLDYYSRKELINSETVVIGHSCGAVFLVKYLIERNLHVKGIITVSGYNNFKSGNPTMDMLNGSFYRSRNGIDRLASLANTRIGFYSDNDPFIPLNVLEEFISDIKASAVKVHNGGHFNTSAGYSEFPQLLDTLNQLI